MAAGLPNSTNIFPDRLGQSKTSVIFAPLFGGIVLKSLKKQGHEQTYIPAIQYQTQKQTWFPQAHVIRERSRSIGITP
jgi:hypothetical protein